MTSRPTLYSLDVTVNAPDEERDFNHKDMDFEELLTILDGYVVGDGSEVSWVFTVVKKVPKDWVVLVDPDHEAECFGPFRDRDKAIEWAKSEFITDTDWIVRAIDKPVANLNRLRPVPKRDGLQEVIDQHGGPGAITDEGSKEYFDRYIAGDR